MQIKVKDYVTNEEFSHKKVKSIEIDGERLVLNLINGVCKTVYLRRYLFCSIEEDLEK